MLLLRETMEIDIKCEVSFSWNTVIVKIIHKGNSPLTVRKPIVNFTAFTYFKIDVYVAPEGNEQLHMGDFAKIC